MDQLGFFLVVCLLASTFVQMVRRVPLRRLQRRSLWQTAGVLGLERAHGLDPWSPLRFAGEIDDYSVDLLDGTQDDPGSSSVHIRVAAPALALFAIDLPGGEWDRAAWVHSQLCLWPPSHQQTLRSLMAQDCSFSLRDGFLTMNHPRCGQSAESTIDLVDELVQLVASLSTVFVDKATSLNEVLGLVQGADAKEEAPLVQCGMAFLLAHADEEFAGAVLACFRKEPQVAGDVRYDLFSQALAGGLFGDAERAEIIEMTLADELPRIQMLGAKYAGHVGYVKLHQMASEEGQDPSLRMEALRHLMASYPRREVALRGLLRRALASENRRLQQVAIEAIIERDCADRSRAHPESRLWLEGLFHGLACATPYQIQLLAHELQALLHQPFGSLEAEWLAIPSLVALMQERTRSTLLPMIRLLKRWALPAGEPLLLGWLSHPSEEVRMSAVRALGACGGAASLAPLKGYARRLWLPKRARELAQHVLGRIEARLVEQKVGYLSLGSPTPTQGSLSKNTPEGALSLAAALANPEVSTKPANDKGPVTPTPFVQRVTPGGLRVTAPQRRARVTQSRAQRRLHRVGRRLRKVKRDEVTP